MTSQIFEQIDSLGETKIHEKNSKNGINALKNFTNQNLNTEKRKTLNGHTKYIDFIGSFGFQF